MDVINYTKTIPAYTYISVNYPLIIVPIGCQFNIPNGFVCSAGFIVYYKF